MNQVRCERRWQAEAGEDGRLEAKDLASFERHAEHCADCSAERTRLQQIAERMRSIPERVPSDLEHRRARNELLRRANEQLMATRPSRSRWSTIALGMALAASLSGIGIFYGARLRSTEARFEVADISQAVWHTETSGLTSRVALQSGAASFHVEHLSQETRFFVDMPDGRIEVRGTRFVVDVSEGKTRSVEVTEGVVWLEVPEYRGILVAGERWPKVVTKAEVSVPTVSPIDATQVAEIIEDAGIQAVGAGSATAKVVASAASASVTKPTGASVDGELAVGGPSSKDDAGPRFAEAMQAFSSGNDGRADELFAMFIRDFPRDGRAEDAMFLRAKSRARHGDAAGAAAMAREYLKVFPRGFRRPEAERLAGEAGPTTAPRAQSQ